MKKMKIAMIISAIVVAAGLALALVGLLMMGFDLKRLDFSHYQSNTHEISEDFSQILIDVDTAEVTVRLSQDGVCRVTCFEDERKLHSVSVQNGTLQISAAEGKWYDYVGIHFQSPTVTVSLPKAAYDALQIDADTGDITLPRELSFTSAAVETHTGDVNWQSAVVDTLSVTTDTGAIEITGVSSAKLQVKSQTGDISVGDGKIDDALGISTHTGEVKLSSIACGSLTLESDTGDVELSNLLATGAISISTNTGDVDLDCCDAETITIHTDTGDVWGILLSEKAFVTKTDTGDVDVPQGTSGGVCEVVTDTGDIELSVRSGA